MTKILVVDDNKGILDALRMALTLFKKEVKCELHATNVFENIEKFKPDLIILDLLLSGENGADICRLLKADERSKHLPVIIMSAHPSAEGIIFEAGADAFLPKPFDLEFLIDLVKKYE